MREHMLWKFTVVNGDYGCTKKCSEGEENRSILVGHGENETVVRKVRSGTFASTYVESLSIR